MLKRYFSSALFLFFCLTTLPPMLLAEDSSARNDVLEEVIVTARKRMETIQESPVAISAMDADALRENGIGTMRDLTSAVPGLNFAEQGSKATSIFIRGVGQREASASLDPGVGVYINGIYIARTDSQLLDTVDTESIQVLRGPQGTLFGKNTTGGAILVTTRSPDVSEFGGELSTRIGNFGRRDAKITLNIPLNDDSLAMRTTLSSVNREGYLDSVNDGQTFGDEDRLAGTARLLWEAGDIFSLDLFGYASKQKETGAAFSCLFANTSGNIASLSYPVDGARTEFETACRQSEAYIEDDKVALNESVFEMENQILALTLSWDLDDYEIKSITAVGRQNHIKVEDDQDGTAVEILQNGTITRDGYFERGGLQHDDEERMQFSQEINVIGSALEERLSYTVGLFIAHENMDNTPFTQTVGPGTFAMVNQFVPGNVYISTHKFLGTQSDMTTDTVALFSQATYDFTETFQLTLGLRETYEKRERDLEVVPIDWGSFAQATGGIYTEETGFGSLVEGIQYPSEQQFLDSYAAYENGTLSIPLDAAGSTREKEDHSWSVLTPSATFAFNFLEDVFNWKTIDSAMLYFTYAEGFKAGGFEPKGTELVMFEPESVTNWEVGAKMDGFDNRMRINMAAYYMDYDDMQIRVAERGERLSDLYLYLTNAGDAAIRGFEFELTVLPMENLRLQAMFNYTDAEYKEFDYLRVSDENGLPIPGGEMIDRSDEPFGGAPKKSGSLTASYDFYTDKFGSFSALVSAFYSDELYIGLDYLSPDYDQSYLDSYTLYSTRINWIPVEQWQFAVFVDNLTDEDYFQGGYGLADSVGGTMVVKGPGRAYGLELYYAF